MFESILACHAGQAGTVASSSDFPGFFAVRIYKGKNWSLANHIGLIRNHGYLGVHELAGEVVSRWNQIEPSLRSTYEKLKKIEFSILDIDKN